MKCIKRCYINPRGGNGRKEERERGIKRKGEIHFTVICLVLSSYGTLAWSSLSRLFLHLPLSWFLCSYTLSFILHLLIPLCAPHSNTCSLVCFTSIFQSIFLICLLSTWHCLGLTVLSCLTSTLHNINRMQKLINTSPEPILSVLYLPMTSNWIRVGLWTLMTDTFLLSTRIVFLHTIVKTVTCSTRISNCC